MDGGFFGRDTPQMSLTALRQWRTGKTWQTYHDLLLSSHCRCDVVLGHFVVGSFTAVVWHLIVMFARYCGVKVTWVISLSAMGNFTAAFRWFRAVESQLMILGVWKSFGKKNKKLQYETLSLVRKLFISGLNLWNWVLQWDTIAAEIYWSMAALDPHAKALYRLLSYHSPAALMGSYLAPLSVWNHKNILVFGVTVVIVCRERWMKQ